MSVLSSSSVADAAARAEALDCASSFIVRAPAGSGKTRLLIQRYLALLSRVDEPEEVIAITFTRKAAAEMRARVIAAFTAAASSTDDGISQDETTLALARSALERDRVRGWALAQNPSRLRITTIDSLSASITRQMPLLSRFGAQPAIVEDASVLYRRAARELLSRLNASHDSATDDRLVSDDIATLLTHLDNQTQTAEALIAEMLMRRDHWLRHLKNLRDDAMVSRHTLEAPLVRMREQAIAALAAAYPRIEKTETLELASYSGQNIAETDADSRLSRMAYFTAMPSHEHAAFDDWLALSDLFLTKEGDWRKTGGYNVKSGFPPGVTKEEKALCGAMKSRMQALLTSVVEGDQSGALHRAFLALRACPPAAYTDAQWRVLGAIIRLLPQAIAHLWAVFGETSECDFSEIAQAAKRALGEEGGDDAPTDLALALDYRIQHLLIDEFQDTSSAQFDLLEKLTRGWEQGDGRTLFLVGDPMQSIYRFREAEVALFQRARQHGIGDVRLKPLSLEVNFRSTAGVVEWVNRTFAPLMNRHANGTAGAVPYEHSAAFSEGEPTSAAPSLASSSASVTWHWQTLTPPTATPQTADDTENEAPHDARKQEAARVIDIIRTTQQARADATIAVLVRTRGHLADIVPALKAAGISYQAVDIDPLRERQIVTDLFALTRAITHVGDRIAWLAILRAPWCGLSLLDLARLVDGVVPNEVDRALAPDSRTVLDMLCDETRLQTLSSHGVQAARRVCEVMQHARSLHRIAPLADLVERTWRALGGLQCGITEDDFADAEVYLRTLHEEAVLQSGGTDIVDHNALESRVDRLFSASDIVESGDVPPVQLMTIHKSKGLEWDTVIVPALDRRPRLDQRRLLLWTEREDADSGESELLVAPIRSLATAERQDEIYRVIQAEHDAAQAHEDVRLMYVAATRAERQLHLLATLKLKRKDDVVTVAAPSAQSLLGALAPALDFSAALATTQADSANGRTAISDSITNASQSTAAMPAMPTLTSMRLRADWAPPEVDLQLVQKLASHTSIASHVTAGPSASLATRATASTVDFVWASDVARHVGTVVHRYLQKMAQDGIGNWNEVRIDALDGLLANALRECGVASDELMFAVARCKKALRQTLADARGQWILASHAHAKSEWRLSGVVDGALVHVAIDRTFVDESGTRWIIDYKTGDHLGADVDAFLDNEVARYREQLESYAALVAKLSSSPMPIKLGLYFPLLGGWREWSYADSDA